MNTITFKKVISALLIFIVTLFSLKACIAAHEIEEAQVLSKNVHYISEIEREKK